MPQNTGTSWVQQYHDVFVKTNIIWWALLIGCVLAVATWVIQGVTTKGWSVRFLVLYLFIYNHLSVIFFLEFSGRDRVHRLTQLELVIGIFCGVVSALSIYTVIHLGLLAPIPAYYYLIILGYFIGVSGLARYWANWFPSAF